MRTKWFVLLVAVLVALILNGCGSNGGSGGSDVGDSDDLNKIPTVGINNCAVCHDKAFENFLNTLDVPASNGMKERSNAHGNADGKPSINASDSCLKCHDPAGDGTTLFVKFGASSERPIPGCESCHGGGSAHRGVGPIPYPGFDLERCAYCHNAHGNNIDSLVEDYELSSHATHSHGSSASCQRCHTHDGAIEFGDQATGNRDVMTALNATAVPDPQRMICATCHDEHYYGFRIPKDWSFGGDPQFDLCTSCHTLLDHTIGDAWVKDNSYHNALDERNAQRTIEDTHFDDPKTANTSIEGYVVRNNGDSACSDCHDVHATDRSVFEEDPDDPPEDPDNNPIDINRDWAESAHAGKIALAKYNAITNNEYFYNTAVTNNDQSKYVAVWANRNWDEDRRGSCQVCHTTTGLKNFLEDPTSPDATSGYDLSGSDNIFDHLSGWTASTGSPQNELLYCWGCHSNVSTGALINNPPIHLHDRDDFHMGTLPDSGSSNVCFKCHGGRANGEYIRNTLAADRSSSGRIHYRSSAGTLFAEFINTGYEFDLDNDGDAAEHYVNDALVHDEIKLNLDDPETGSGPCAGCHMPDSDHHFSAVIKDETTDSIIEITAQSLCDECHGNSFGPGLMQTLSDYYKNSLAFFSDVATLANGQTNYVPANFDSSSFLRSRPDTVSGKNDYGAWQNYEYLADDPGAYTHNSLYARRIIFDSIDWLQDGALTGDITIPAAYPGARAWLKADSNGKASRP